MEHHVVSREWDMEVFLCMDDVFLMGAVQWDCVLGQICEHCFLSLNKGTISICLC